MTKSELILKLAEMNPHLYQRDVAWCPRRTTAACSARPRVSDYDTGPSRGSLEETFRELADEELLRRCASGELTELAQAVAQCSFKGREEDRKTVLSLLSLFFCLEGRHFL